MNSSGYVKIVLIVLFLFQFPVLKAQEYKKLAAGDLIFLNKEKFDIDIVKSDSSYFKEGYYEAPYDKTKNSQLFFHVGANGKLRDSVLAIVPEEKYRATYFLIDGRIHGTAKTYVNHILVQEFILDHGVLKVEKNFENGKIVRQTNSGKDGAPYSILEYENGLLKSESNYEESTVTNYFPSGKIKEWNNNNTGVSKVFYPDGKLKVLSTEDKDAKTITVKTFDSRGSLLKELIENQRSPLKDDEIEKTQILYFPDKKVKSKTTTNALEEITILYNEAGKVIKRTKVAVPPTIKMQ